MNEQSMGNTDRDLVDPNLSGSSIDFSIDDSFANAADDSGKRKINASTILFGCVLVASGGMARNQTRESSVCTFPSAHAQPSAWHRTGRRPRA